MAAGEEATVANNKIIAVGVGQVGKACESSILGKSLADELALVNAWKCICSMGTSFFRHLKLWQRTDHPVTMGITAGVHQRERESHLSPVRRNVFFKFIIPAIIKYSPNCIISEASNPVDILIYITWKLSGWLKHHVIESGCQRFHYFMAENLAFIPAAVMDGFGENTVTQV